MATAEKSRPRDAANVLPPPANSGHVVQFYHDDRVLLDTIGQSVGDALAAGDAALVVATPPHREGLAARLRARGFDVDAAVQSRRLVQLDAAETMARFMVAGLPDPARFDQVVGGAIRRLSGATPGTRRAFVFGEMVALLWEEDAPEAAIRLEHLWNELAASNAFFLHCAYPVASFSRVEHGHGLARICHAHSAVIPDESYTSLTETNQRMRAIVELQQKARALGAETTQRVREQQRADQAVRTMETWQRLLDAQNEERQRIARELHDRTHPLLASLVSKLFSIRHGRQGLTPASASVLEDCLRLAEDTAKAIRGVSRMMDPPMLAEAGLLASLRLFLSGMREQSQIAVDAALPAKLPPLSRNFETAIYRVVQESLSLLPRYTGSRRAKLALKVEDAAVVVEIHDTGPSLPSYLLEQIECGQDEIGSAVAGMRQHIRHLGGEFDLHTSGSGTRVVASLPLQA